MKPLSRCSFLTLVITSPSCGFRFISMCLCASLPLCHIHPRAHTHTHHLENSHDSFICWKCWRRQKGRQYTRTLVVGFQGGGVASNACKCRRSRVTFQSFIIFFLLPFVLLIYSAVAPCRHILFFMSSTTNTTLINFKPGITQVFPSEGFQWQGRASHSRY